MTKASVLIVEDDPEISRLTAMYLHTEGYESIVVEDGLHAIPTLKTHHPDIMILDLMLPGLDGSEICKQAREFYHGPILVLTACADDMSEVSMLRLGADDYITKPIRPHILVARIEALLRRASKTNPTPTVLAVNGICIEPQSQTTTFHGAELQLTAAEYEMLLLLVTHAGQVVTRETCCRSLRGIDYDYNDRSIDMRISSLRKKLNDGKFPYKLILTIRNKGYMLVNG